MIDKLNYYCRNCNEKSESKDILLNTMCEMKDPKELVLLWLLSENAMWDVSSIKYYNHAEVETLPGFLLKHYHCVMHGSMMIENEDGDYVS